MLNEFGLRLNSEDVVSLFNRVKSHRIQGLSTAPAENDDRRALEEEKLLADCVSCTAFHAFLVSRMSAKAKKLLYLTMSK